MINLLIAGFATLVLGLNLMMIWSALNTMATNTTASQTRLERIGMAVTFIGFTVLGLGIFRLLTTPSLETGIILSTGSSVISLGIASIVRARGYGHERVVFACSWVAAGIGIGLILSYSMVVYVLRCAC
jgi:hypothetical protein